MNIPNELFTPPCFALALSSSPFAPCALLFARLAVFFARLNTFPGSSHHENQRVSPSRRFGYRPGASLRLALAVVVRRACAETSEGVAIGSDPLPEAG